MVASSSKKASLWTPKYYGQIPQGIFTFQGHNKWLWRLEKFLKWHNLVIIITCTLTRWFIGRCCHCTCNYYNGHLNYSKYVWYTFGHMRPGGHVMKLPEAITVHCGWWSQHSWWYRHTTMTHMSWPATVTMRCGSGLWLPM